MKDQFQTVLFATLFLFLVLNGTVTTQDSSEDSTPTQEESQELPEVEVTGAQKDYRVEKASTATRTDTRIDETPFSIQTIPREVIDDQGAFRLEDAFRNVSGVNVEHTKMFTRSQEGAFIRGFKLQNAFKNGFPTNGRGRVDLASVQSVDVLKGPSSILFGAIEPGGVINYTTKKAQPEPFLNVQQSVGSNNFYRTTVDANTPLREDGSLLGRLNIAYTDRDSFRDEVFLKRLHIAPTVTWKLTDDTRIRFDFTLSDEERMPRNDGVPFQFNGEPADNRDEFFNNPELDDAEFRDLTAGYTLTHNITGNLRYRNKFTFHEWLNDKDNLTANFGPITPNDEVDGRLETISDQRVTEYQMFNDLLWDTEFLGVDHTFLAGVDLRHRLENRDARFSGGPGFNALPPLDVFEPDRDPALTARGSNFTDSSRKVEVQWGGIYFQDQMTAMNDRLHVVLGGRYDRYENERREADTDFTVEDVTGRVGALFKATSWLRPYASVSQSFNPTGSRDRSGDVLDPTTGIQYEGGLKMPLLNDQLTITTAGFRIDKEDVAEDLNGDGFPENAGEQRSEGFEIDVSGQLAPGLRIIASYAHLDTEVVESARLPDGEPLRNAPENSGSLWLSYDFQKDSGLDGFGFGGGLFYSDEKAGDSSNSFQLPSYETVDVGVWYKHTLESGQRINARLNVSNLFNEEFYPASFQQTRVRPGQARFIKGTLGVEF